MNELGHLYSTSCHIFNIAFQHQCFSYKFPKKHICCMNSPYLNTLNRCFWWYSLALAPYYWPLSRGQLWYTENWWTCAALGRFLGSDIIVQGWFSRCWKGMTMGFSPIGFPLSKGPSFPWKGCSFGCICWWNWSSLARDRTGIEYWMQTLESPGG